MRHFRGVARRKHKAMEPSCLLEPMEPRQFLSTTIPNIMPLGDSTITEAFTGHAELSLLAVEFAG